MRGLARSFQITSLFADFTALDNVALAVQAHAGNSFHFWRNARHEEGLRAPARAALERVGLSHRADNMVSSMGTCTSCPCPLRSRCTSAMPIEDANMCPQNLSAMTVGR